MSLTQLYSETTGHPHSALWDTLFLTEGDATLESAHISVCMCWRTAGLVEEDRGHQKPPGVVKQRLLHQIEGRARRSPLSEGLALRRTEALPTHNQRTLLELLDLLGCQVNTAKIVTTSNLSQKYILYMRHRSTKSIYG